MPTQVGNLSRRGIIAGAATVAAFGAKAQPRPDTVGTPPSVITNPAPSPSCSIPTISKVGPVGLSWDFREIGAPASA